MKKTAIAVALSASLLIAAAPVTHGSELPALIERANMGDAQAVFMVGKHYLENNQTARGILYLEHVIREGGDQAAFAHAALAKHYEKLADTSIARETMLYHYRAAAVLGEVGSQVKLGSFLLEDAAKGGTDAERIGSQAAALLDHAANAGDSKEAAFQLGRAYHEGKGLARDPSRAARWLGKAADGGHLEATYLLGMHGLAVEDQRIAKRHLERAAERGHTGAMVALAGALESGKVLRASLDEASKWANKADRANAPGAKAVLARVADKRRPAPAPVTPAAPVTAVAHQSAPVENSEQRQAWVTPTVVVEPPSASRVATGGGMPARPVPPQGAPQAESEVERLRKQVEMLSQQIARISGDAGPRPTAQAAYVAPEVIPPPPVEEKLSLNQQGLDAHARGEYDVAYKLFDKAARKGDVDALNNMGMLLLQGMGVGADPAQAMVMFRRAAGQGHVTAAHNIGYMYENGIGVRTDLARSRVWYQHSQTLNERNLRYANL
ncbi:MAG: hypothetical protein A2580_13350 [Hydrogenophilales bacterium RIFOXYD1_FULL_62_11]|nr:MAG: hypothetical protein A2580_13350 [Hydrogenophilales bacterium RIFOXYD1_FULL_62_11]